MPISTEPGPWSSDYTAPGAEPWWEQDEEPKRLRSNPLHYEECGVHEGFMCTCSRLINAHRPTPNTSREH